MPKFRPEDLIGTPSPLLAHQKLFGNKDTDWALTKEHLVNPDHFADGQRFARIGIEAAMQFGETGGYTTLFNLFHHFDKEGTVADALKWLKWNLPRTNGCPLRYRRHIISYVVRWVRVRRVQRRLIPAESEQEAVEQLRGLLRRGVKSSSSAEIVKTQIPHHLLPALGRIETEGLIVKYTIRDIDNRSCFVEVALGKKGMEWLDPFAKINIALKLDLRGLTDAMTKLGAGLRLPTESLSRFGQSVRGIGHKVTIIDDLFNQKEDINETDRADDSK